MTPKQQIKAGNTFPYDAPDAWWNDLVTEKPKAVDWAHSAARGILNDLQGRQGIKHSLHDVDEATRMDIVKSIAAIVRAAAPANVSGQPCPADDSAKQNEHSTGIVL